MRIVAVADTHLYHHELDVPDGDVFVHAGDMCRGGSLAELAEALAWLRSLPHRHKVIVAGNHDGALVDDADEARAMMTDVVYLEDSGEVIEGVSFWGSPWQPEYHGWWFNLPRGEPLARRWALVPSGVDVLVTHGPPAGFGDRSGMGAERAGCDDLLRRVTEVRPKLHLFGHIHEDGGAWTHGESALINCTTWEAERAPTVIDLVGGQVRLVQVPPARRDR